MCNLDFQTGYWDRAGPTKLFSHSVNVERLRQLLSPASRIIDYGCGYGRALGILQASGFTNLTGFDPAPAMLAAARQHWPAIKFQLLERPAQLPVPEKSADAVLLLGVLTCVPSDDGQRRILEELRRVLRTGGLLYIADFWLQTDPRNLERYEHGQVQHGQYGVFDLPEGVTLRHHSRPWIDSLTNRFELVAIDDLEVMTMNGHLAQGFQWFGRKNA